jgi:hypothetical protein
LGDRRHKDERLPGSAYEPMFFPEQKIIIALYPEKQRCTAELSISENLE